MSHTFLNINESERQSGLFDFDTEMVPQEIVKVEPDKPIITIFVSCDWELRPDDYGNLDASGRKYSDIYRGGWTITKCVGHPEINGGFGTPDMMALYPTEKSIIQGMINRYSDYFDGMYQIKVKLKVTKDDRKTSPKQICLDSMCPRCEVGNHIYCNKREDDPPYKCTCDCPNGEFGK